MDSLNELQIVEQYCRKESDPLVTVPDPTPTQIREKPNTPNVWKFSENRVEFNFENLVLLIRLFLFMCVFYVVIWIFRDKNADIRSTAQLFSIYNSLFCSVLSIYYYLTGSTYAVFIIVASLFSYTIADIYYGYFHYHHIMCGLNGYVHHFVYLFILMYFLYYDFSNITAAFSMCEIATFFVNIKHVFSIDSLALQIVILVAFLLFRVIAWAYLTYINIHLAGEYYLSGFFTATALLLHTHWTYIHTCKTWKKYFTK